MNTEQFDYLKSYPKVHDAVLEVHRRMETEYHAKHFFRESRKCGGGHNSDGKQFSNYGADGGGD